MVSCQLSKKYILWPVSHDCIVGSSVQLIEVTFFYSYPLTSYWFLIDSGLRSKISHGQNTMSCGFDSIARIVSIILPVKKNFKLVKMTLWVVHAIYSFSLGQKAAKLTLSVAVAWLKANEYYNLISSIDEAEDPASVPVYWVSKWVDYSDKYGFGYQLSDNSVGVLFNDQTRLILYQDEV